MIIAVVGLYSAPTTEERQKNLDAMTIATAKLLKARHIPIIGMNAANKERDLLLSKGKTVYNSLNEILQKNAIG